MSFSQALALAPNSPREQLNCGSPSCEQERLETGIAQLEKVQARPQLPHTWFNLGVTFQKQGEFDRLPQFQEMVKLVPKEPISYHLGALHKVKGDRAAAIKEFETARDLNPRLARISSSTDSTGRRSARRMPPPSCAFSRTSRSSRKARLSQRTWTGTMPRSTTR